MKLHKFLKKYIKDFVAIAFWIYAVSKLFIFDIDIFIISKLAPQYIWLLKVKFIILIGFLALIFLVAKKREILIWLSYIIFYPLLLVIWKIPVLIFKRKDWILAFAFINSMLSFFRSFKYNFIISAIFLISFCIILASSKPIVLWPSLFAVLIILTITYANMFVLIFKPSHIFQILRKVLSKLKEGNFSSFALEENLKIQPLEELSKEQQVKWVSKLTSSVAYNRFWLFAARKLRDYQNSGLLAITLGITLLLLMIFTVISFSGINYALYKINDDFYSFSHDPSFFTFFYYSANVSVFNSISELSPASPITQVAQMAELFFGLVIVAILVSLILPARKKRLTDELDQIIGLLQKESEAIETFIRDEYKIVGIQAAIVVVREKGDSDSVQLIDRLNKALEN